MEEKDTLLEDVKETAKQAAEKLETCAEKAVDQAEKAVDKAETILDRQLNKSPQKTEKLGETILLTSGIINTVFGVLMALGGLLGALFIALSGSLVRQLFSAALGSHLGGAMGVLLGSGLSSILIILCILFLLIPGAVLIWFGIEAITKYKQEAAQASLRLWIYAIVQTVLLVLALILVPNALTTILFLNTLAYLVGAYLKRRMAA